MYIFNKINNPNLKEKIYMKPLILSLSKGEGTLNSNFLPIIDYFSNFEKTLFNLK